MKVEASAVLIPSDPLKPSCYKALCSHFSLHSITPDSSSFKEATKTSISSMAIPNVSSSSSSQRNHDVFLSFRGEDTRNTFIGHLYNALVIKGIKTYRDDVDLRKGDEISPALLEAIEESKISFIVFSKNYATSTWCLDELVQILKCRNSIGQMVLPIFYDVDPSNVRKQFGEVMVMHEKKFKDDMQRVSGWKAALKEAANLSGWHLSNGHESDFIQSIVEEISSTILKRTLLDVAKNPLGLDSHIHAMTELLSVGDDNVRMVGIHGIRGIGKTTIAKAVYNLLANQFQSCSFLANVRETTTLGGLVQLQEKLLYDILGKTNLKLGNVDEGITVIKDRLRHKKVLVVLDDVSNKLKQLDKLAGDKNWFGPGSRIIITTRDQHILETHEVETKYKVQGLSDDAALQLLSLNAFKKSYPEKGYEKLADLVVQYAKGLPLVLVVLGSLLYRRGVPEWESTISEMQRSHCNDIYEVLKISFDAMEDNQKAISTKGEPDFQQQPCCCPVEMCQNNYSNCCPDFQQQPSCSPEFQQKPSCCPVEMCQSSCSSQEFDKAITKRALA